MCHEDADRRTQKQTECSTQNLFKTKQRKQNPRGGKTEMKGNIPRLRQKVD